MKARAFKALPFCSSLLKITGRDFWSSRNKRKPTLKAKCVLQKCSRVSQKWWKLELSKLCHFAHHPWKLTGRDFWSSRNKRKPLSQQKCVLRKCCGVSQKWWLLELSNLCHCFQHPWTLTSRDFWSSRNEREPLTQQNYVFRNCCGVSKWCACWSFQIFAIVFSTPENLLVGISGALRIKKSLSQTNMCFEKIWRALGMKKKHFLRKNVF